MPDDFFKKVEAAARQQQDNSVTERLNQVYAGETERLNPGLHRAQLASLKKEVW